MGFWLALNHLVNFLAPALWLALLLPVSARLLIRAKPGKPSLKTQVGLHSIAGSGVLLAGLLFFGRDGKMLTYLALVLLAASLQWVWLRR